MKFKRLFGIAIIVITTYLATDQVNGQSVGKGKIVFTTRKPFRNLNGFRITTETRRGKNRKSLLNWWPFYAYNICSINPDGTDLKQLTDNGTSRKPRWSPNGNWIAYISGLDLKESLAVMKPDGTIHKELLKRQYRIIDFWWSPDSQKILVAVEIDRQVDPIENVVVTLEGDKKGRRRMPRWTEGWYHWNPNSEVINPKRKLIEALPKEVSWPEWSPDGHWISFVTDNLLMIAEVETTSATGRWFQQRSEPTCQNIEEWSPSGDRILFYTSGEICVASINQGKFAEVVNLSMMPGWDATWGPEGKRVAFISRDQKQRRVNQIFVMDAFTGQVDQITFTNYDHFDPHWK